MSNFTKKSIEKTDKGFVKVNIKPGFDHILIGDISGSMDSKDSITGRQTRLQYMTDKFIEFITEALKVDPDGPDVVLFSSQVQVFASSEQQKIDPESIRRILQSPSGRGSTNTALAIKTAYDMHKKKKAKNPSLKGTVVQVFTDGEADSRSALKDAIISIANEISYDEEFSIAFVPVGAISKELADYLNFLDNQLTKKQGGFLGFGGTAGAKFDIVDVASGGFHQLQFQAVVDGAKND